MKIKNNPFVRKGLSKVRSVKRFAARMMSKPKDYEQNPPVICDSFPKSGTHLLLQVLQALPDKTHYGSFVATTPSIVFKRGSDASIIRKIRALAPGELLPAHMYYSEPVAQALNELHCVHYFIYRDLRDVLLSEINYLTSNAWWHALHRPFKKAGNDLERWKLSLRGMVDRFSEYPNIAKRFGFYEGWIGRDDTLPVRFEDLTSDQRDSTLEKIAQFYNQRTGRTLDVAGFVKDAIHEIQPGASHTFHKGESGRGRKNMPEELREEFNELAGDLMKKLGYQIG